MCKYCNYRLINYYISLIGLKMKYINYEWLVVIYYQFDLIYDTMWYKNNNFKVIIFFEIYFYMCVFLQLFLYFCLVKWID